MDYNSYLRVDGTIRKGWTDEPAAATDRRLYNMGPLRRRYAVGERLQHRRLGTLICVACKRLVNEDQCADWGGPSFGGDFVHAED
ncbi:MAG: hypothetical protein PHI12_08995 [Dehalococcoidales bacterium]|nr:hypothetical protein [Dehalococcoidales bacterium]